MTLPRYYKEIDDMSELECKALLMEIRTEVSEWSLKLPLTLNELNGKKTFWDSIYDLFTTTEKNNGR